MQTDVEQDAESWYQTAEVSAILINCPATAAAAAIPSSYSVLAVSTNCCLYRPGSVPLLGLFTARSARSVMPFYTAIPTDLFYCCRLAVLPLLLLPLLFQLFRSIIPIVLLLPFLLTATDCCYCYCCINWLRPTDCYRPSTATEISATY